MALRQRRLGVTGCEAPKALKMRSCSARNLASAAASLEVFCETAMSTMLPEEMLGGRRMEGNSIWESQRGGSNSHMLAGLRHTRRLSGVRRTVTPASTLPTVRETSIVGRLSQMCAEAIRGQLVWLFWGLCL